MSSYSSSSPVGAGADSSAAAADGAAELAAPHPLTVAYASSQRPLTAPAPSQPAAAAAPVAAPSPPRHHQHFGRRPPPHPLTARAGTPGIGGPPPIPPSGSFSARPPSLGMAAVPLSSLSPTLLGASASNSAAPSPSPASASAPSNAGAKGYAAWPPLSRGGSLMGSPSATPSVAGWTPSSAAIAHHQQHRGRAGPFALRGYPPTAPPAASPRQSPSSASTATGGGMAYSHSSLPTDPPGSTPAQSERSGTSQSYSHNALSSEGGLTASCAGYGYGFGSSGAPATGTVSMASSLPFPPNATPLAVAPTMVPHEVYAVLCARYGARPSRPLLSYLAREVSLAPAIAAAHRADAAEEAEAAAIRQQQRFGAAVIGPTDATMVMMMGDSSRRPSSSSLGGGVRSGSGSRQQQLAVKPPHTIGTTGAPSGAAIQYAAIPSPSPPEPDDASPPTPSPNSRRVLTPHSPTPPRGAPHQQHHSNNNSSAYTRMEPRVGPRHLFRYQRAIDGVADGASDGGRGDATLPPIPAAASHAAAGETLDGAVNADTEAKAKANEDEGKEEEEDPTALLPLPSIVLDLSGDYVGPLGAVAVFSLCLHTPFVTRICLSGNGVDNNAVAFLTARLDGAVPWLRSLDLSHNRLLTAASGARLLRFVKANPNIIECLVRDGTSIPRAVCEAIHALCADRRAGRDEAGVDERGDGGLSLSFSLSAAERSEQRRMRRALERYAAVIGAPRQQAHLHANDSDARGDAADAVARAVRAAAFDGRLCYAEPTAVLAAMRRELIAAEGSASPEPAGPEPEPREAMGTAASALQATEGEALVNREDALSAEPVHVTEAAGKSEAPPPVPLNTPPPPAANAALTEEVGGLATGMEWLPAGLGDLYVAAGFASPAHSGTPVPPTPPPVVLPIGLSVSEEEGRSAPPPPAPLRGGAAFPGLAALFNAARGLALEEQRAAP